jgi:hypothetical protein
MTLGLAHSEQSRDIMGYLSDHYRPERHYMRGPGPKWLERHKVFSGSDALSSERKPTNLMRGLRSMIRRRLPTGWHILSNDTREER